MENLWADILLTSHYYNICHFVYFRFTAWFLHKLLSHLLSGILVDSGQLEMVKRACRVSDTPNIMSTDKIGRLTGFLPDFNPLSVGYLLLANCLSVY